MAHTWQLREANSRFTKVVKLAGSEVEAVVALSMEEDWRLEAGRSSLVEYLMAGPKIDDATIAEINDRFRDTGREIEL